MNQVYIGEPTNFAQWPNAFCVAFEQADQYLQILRSDFFTKVTVSLPLNIQDKQLRFTMHLSRILKQKVCSFWKFRAKFDFKTLLSPIKPNNLSI